MPSPQESTGPSYATARAEVDRDACMMLGGDIFAEAHPMRFVVARLLDDCAAPDMFSDQGITDETGHVMQASETTIIRAVLQEMGVRADQIPADREALFVFARERAELLLRYLNSDRLRGCPTEDGHGSAK